MKKLAFMFAVLVSVASVQAAEHWRGPGWGGDGTSWSDVRNWDEIVPSGPTAGSGTSWDVNRTGEQGTPGNHVINIDVNGYVSTGTVFPQPGYKTTINVLSGVTFDTYNLILQNNSGGHLTVQPGAQLNVDEQDAYLILGAHCRMTVMAGGGFLNDWLRLEDGYAILDVYGTVETWGIQKFSDDAGHEINVRSGGLFRLGAGGINWDGNPNRRINVYNLGTVQRQGDHTADYLSFVTNKQAGTWVVDYNVTRAGFTTIKLVAPCWDHDDDNDVDMADYGAFQRCVTLDPAVSGASSGCECYDLRGSGGISVSDGAIDAWDLAAFITCASGPGVPADPVCVD